jgi:ATP-binding dynein motor region
MGKTMIVNYGVTMDGLANQLLNVVVAHERADLEESYAALVTQMSESASLLVSSFLYLQTLGYLQGLTGLHSKCTSCCCVTMNTAAVVSACSTR